MPQRIEDTFISDGAIESLIGGRSENQDSCAYESSAEGSLVVVCDGMGGMGGGAVASSAAVKAIVEDFRKWGGEVTAREFLLNAIRHANEVIRGIAASDASLSNMGTTLTAIVIGRYCVAAAYLGDSRIYQLRGGRKVFRTVDHSMVFRMVESGVITEEQARLSADSNVIYQGLGPFNEVSPVIYELPYLKGDRFLLCTDGFWGALPEKDLLRKTAVKEPGEAMLHRICVEIDTEAKYKGGGHDNLSAAVVTMRQDSIMKVKMSKSQKAIVIILSVLLLASLALNAALCGRLHSHGGNVGNISADADTTIVYGSGHVPNSPAETKTSESE